MSTPRYVWRAIVSHEGVPAFELLFDATAILQGNFFFRAVEYDHALLRVMRNLAAINFAPDDITRAIFSWFRDH